MFQGSGVISGVQDELNGEITWNTELPQNCLLNPHLKNIITPLLAGLLESDESKIWSFEKFFNEVRLILLRRIVNVFHVTSSTLIKVYLKRDEGLEQLQSYIHERTSLLAEDQILMYKSALLKVDHVAKISEDSFVYLFSKQESQVVMPALKTFPSSLAFSISTVMMVVEVAKTRCVIGHEIRRLIEQFVTFGKLIYEAVENMSKYMSATFSEMERQAKHLRNKINILKSMEIVEVSQRISGYKSMTNRSEELKQISTNFVDNIWNDVCSLHGKHLVENFLQAQWDSITKNSWKPSETKASIR